MKISTQNTTRPLPTKAPASQGKPGASENSNSPSDEELIARIRARDMAAFKQLMGRYEEKLYRLAMRFVRSQTDAQEILQDVFLSAWRKIPTFEGRSQIGTWLYRVTVNAALMLLRARSRHPEVALSDVDLSGANDSTEFIAFGASLDWSRKPDEHLQSGELRRQIRKEVDSLPIELRRVFLVRDVEGFSTRETAQSLGLSRPAVKTRLHRARAALRQNMAMYLAG